MAPNAARIMDRFGLLDKIMGKANVIKRNSLRRWRDGEELGTAPLMPGVCFLQSLREMDTPEDAKKGS